MATLDDLWHDLFAKPITNFERRIMTGVLDYVGERSAILVLSAILVYFLTFVLLRDPNSLLVTSKKIGNAMEDLEKRLNDNEQFAFALMQAQRDLWTEVAKTRNVLAIARRDAEERRGLPLLVYINIGFVCFASVGVALMLSALIGR